MHSDDKAFSCSICQKSFLRNAHLSAHYKSYAHLEKVGTKNIGPSSNKSTFVNSGENIKVEDIKEEIREEESVDYHFTINHEIENSNACEDIKKEEIIEGENVEVPSFNQQEIGNVLLDYSSFFIP